MTTIINLDHLFDIYNIKSCLVDMSGKRFLRSKFNDLDFAINYINDLQYTKEDLTKLVASDCNKEDEDKQLKKKYDLIIVSDPVLFQNLFHKCVFIYILDKEKAHILDPFYEKLSSFGEGLLYRNDFHSLTWDDPNLSVYQQTYIRDKPYRFLKKMVELSQGIFDIKNVIEIGSSRKPIDHPVDEINPVCCNDSHSTFFLTRINNATIHTCDINPMCKTILHRANEDGLLEFGEGSNLKIHIKDGVEFLEGYAKKKKNPTIDLLFLDAWDIGTYEYAKNHSRAYHAIKDKLSESCIIAIDDTDIAKNGKGRYLIPELLNDNFIMVYNARHTLFYKAL